MNKIAITTTSFGVYDETPIKICEDSELEVLFNPYGRKVTKNEFIDIAQGCLGVIAGTEVIDRGVLLKLPDLKVISRCGVGLDNIDMNAVKKADIRVYNTPLGPTLAVAELTVGLILNILRKVSQMDRQIRTGKWEKKMGTLLTNKNVGIIGFGNIGRKVADLLKKLGSNVSFFDPAIKEKLKGYNYVSLEDLLAGSDIISIHASTKNKILGEKEFKLIKEGAFLINIARGEAVDERVLLKSLKNGRISGCALDVFEKEPYEGELIAMENTILTPHVGSYAKEARIEMEKRAASNLLKGLKEKGLL